MIRLSQFILIGLVISSCGSPMNHRVEPQEQIQKKLNTMSLENLALDAEIQWLTGPAGNIKVNNQLMVIFRNKDGVPSDLPKGLTVNFYATMPSMNHPMDNAGDFEPLGHGIYLNSTIRYNMPGDWLNELWIMDSEYNIKDKVLWDDFF